MGKADKERMGQDMKYVIDSETYEKHIRDEVHLYGLLHHRAEPYSAPLRYFFAFLPLV